MKRKGTEQGILVKTSSLLDDADFGDSLLQHLVHTGPLVRIPAPGERLGGANGQRFELREELGRGSMGKVYRAWDEELHRVVALKFLWPRAGHLESSLGESIKQEARAIARLDHENIVRIHDVSEWSQPGGPAVPFLVMECLEGESLEALLRRGRLALRRAVELMRGVASGLAHAHHRHIVHRDLKPRNVFITRAGTVKLLDFGLAHLMAASTSALPDLPTAGTPAYMAPEQWTGEMQDERTDVWAAGSMLYEMLTGQLPYPNESLEELGALVTSDEPVPPARERCPELPREVEPLLAAALAKNPNRRLPSAQELLEGLSELEERLGLRRDRPRPVAPERRQVTLVACRLRCPTSPSDECDPEDRSELEATFYRCCSDIIQRHGGSIALSMDDEVLACFGFPQAHEEDSEQAIRAGMQLVRSLPELLARHSPPAPPTGLAVSVAVHTDTVVVNEGQPHTTGSVISIQGEAPKVAFWLARQAQPSAVLVTGATWALVRGAFELEPLGSHAVEALARREVETYQVHGERRVVFRFDRMHTSDDLTRLVGREQELSELLGYWEQARRGQGSFILISGEPGIGKSRLIREVRERVAPEANCRLRCQCWPQSSSSAYYPLIEMLRRFFQEEYSGQDSRREWQAIEEWLGRFELSQEQVQLLALLLSVPVPENLPIVQLSAERRKETTLTALSNLVLQLSRQTPVLAVVEDLHWADPSTLEVLGALLEHVGEARILLLLSTRPQQPRLFRRPHPRLHRLTLERLPVEGTVALVREAAGSRPLPDEVVQQLVTKTEGVPLFVEEMTHMVLEQAATSAPTARIPASLHELLLARLDMLPSRQRMLAQLCATVGRSIPYALLARLTQQPAAILQWDLEGLLAAGMLKRLDTGPAPEYQFRHALIQDAASQSLLRSTRQQYHRRIAQVLVEQFPETLERQPELVAHHYTEAGEHKAAIPYWARAGVFASLRSANKEAIGHLTRALTLLRGLPDASSRPRGPSRMDWSARASPCRSIERWP